MKDTEKFELRIYESGHKDVSFVVTSDIPFILPRVGDIVNTFGFDQKNPERLLKVMKVTHWFYANNSFMTHQTVNIQTEITT
jgi:hypothetical protein